MAPGGPGCPGSISALASSSLHPGRFCVPSPLAAIWPGGQVMQAGTFAAMPEEVRVVAAGRLGQSVVCPNRSLCQSTNRMRGLSCGG